MEQQELVGTITRVFHEIQAPSAQREHKRLHLGTVMKSPDINKIFTFIAFRDEDQRCQPAAGRIPTITRLGHPSSNTANWSIRLPGDKRAYGSFREIIGGR